MASETTDLKGKGKGKGKGKSNLVQSKAQAAEEEEDEEKGVEVKEVTPDKKNRKSANELYHSLLKAAPDSGDEDSEDSEDDEFHGGELTSCSYIRSCPRFSLKTLSHEIGQSY